MSVFEFLGIEGSAVLVALAVLLGLLGVFAAMALFARNYIKVPPSTVAIFYGRKHTFTDEKGSRSTVGFRVVRGGSYSDNATPLRSGYHNGATPNGRDPSIGVRCARAR